MTVKEAVGRDQLVGVIRLHQRWDARGVGRLPQTDGQEGGRRDDKTVPGATVIKVRTVRRDPTRRKRGG